MSDGAETARDTPETARDTSETVTGRPGSALADTVLERLTTRDFVDGARGRLSPLSVREATKHL
ncbi:hypothetical protein [Streptomyces sp. NPDC048669]|uniref:hypothetical protein n=1 Tax=Streptomyces sp. NPDC048669 TaxID=3155267 RepID=UPI003445BB65